MSREWLTWQRDFTQLLRHPGRPVALPGVSEARLAVYQSLVRNNLLGFVESTYPVAAALLPDALWQSLGDSFMADARCTSPRFVDIPLHFREHVASLKWPQLQPFPWLNELLHYEWMELAADIAEVSAPPDCPLPGWRLGVPVWPLAYHWPVASWTTETETVSLQPGLQAVLFWRTAELTLRRECLSPLTVSLVERLAESGPCVTEQLVDWAVSQGVPNAGAQVPAALARLRALGVATEELDSTAVH